VPQLASDRAEDTGTARFAVVLENHGGVLVEADVGTVRATAFLAGTNHDRPDDVAVLDVPAGNRILDGGDERVADAGVATSRAAEHAHAQDFLGAGVVGDLQSRLLLDHSIYSCRRAGSRPRRAWPNGCLSELSCGPAASLTWPFR